MSVTVLGLIPETFDSGKAGEAELNKSYRINKSPYKKVLRYVGTEFKLQGVVGEWGGGSAVAWPV